MFNLTHLFRSIIPVMAAILLCTAVVPDAHANNSPSLISAQTTDTTSPDLKDTKDQKQPKATQKPSQKSIFDADVLERPLSYFISSFSSDEDDDDDAIQAHGSTIIIMIKALLASLLSTII